MARSCGKVILLGEHGVVYGVPAIAAGIDRGVEALATPTSVSSIAIEGVTVEGEHRKKLSQALAALLSALDLGPVSVRARSELPMGSGLGASAALGVAVARAALDASGLGGESRSDEELMAAVGAWEGVFHGNASGIDAAAATLGGCFRYSRDQGATKIELGQPILLAIAVAGPPSPTSEMVQHVARLNEKKPTLVQKTLEGMRALVTNAEACLRSGDLEGLGKLFDLNQMLLSGILVSTSDIEAACEAARNAGALGAKLTGAGGGGAVIALVREDPEPVLAAFRLMNLNCFGCRIE